MTSAANPIGPTVPNDIKNETVMRAWYQEMWASVRDLVNERISVKDYGAAGDGTTDDTTAFVTALSVANDQTKVLWIPQGNYRITSTITVANPVMILGEGKEVSVIEPYLGTSGGDVFLITSSNVAIADLGFDGVNVGAVTLTNNEFMIHVNPTSGTLDNFYFKNLRFENLNFSAGVKDLTTEADVRAAYAIKVEDTDIINIETCYVKDISGGFVYTTGVSHIDISKNYVEDALLHPVCIHDTTYYFNITDNHFNPVDAVGVFSGGVIDVSSVSGTQCHHGNITGNFIKGVYNTSGYVSYGAVIRVLSSTDINISNNYITEIGEGSLNSDSDFVDNFNIKIGTYGTSSADDNGPCKRISIKNNYISGARDVNTYHLGGILVENNYQTSNLLPAEDIQIIGNHLYSSGSGTSWLERGIVINGKSSGVKNVTIEDNYVVVAPETPASGLSGRGAVSIISDDSTGKCYQIKIGGNRIENLKNDGAIATAACLTIGQYTSEVFNTKPNYLKGYSYGVVTETGAGSDLWYLDDNYYEPAGANTTKFVFNVQPRSKHINLSGNTASRPTSTDYLTNYMTYFDTTLGTPVWYNGSSWIQAWGSAALVDATGTPVNNQVAVFTDANTIEGTTALVFDGTTLSVGTNDSMTVNGSAVTSMIASNSSTQAIVETDTSSDTAGTGSVTYLARSRGTLGARTIVQSGDTIGTIAAVGYDGADFALGSRIDFVVGATPGLNDMPTNILFKVSADGAQNPATAMTINYDKTISTADTFTAVGSINVSGTAASAADIKLYEDTDNGTNYISLKAPATLAGDVTLTLPVDDGTASQFLQTDGAGVLSWATGSGGAPIDATYVTLSTNANLTNERVLTAGTGISITDAGAGSTATVAVTTVPVANGGTGQTTYTNGQLLIGNTTGNTLAKATLTEGSGIKITNGTGSITIGNKVAPIRVGRTSTQSLSAATHTKIQLNVESFDADGTFDSSTDYRHTPTVAGKYFYNAALLHVSPTDQNLLITELYLNGAVQAQAASAASGTTNVIVSVSDIIEMNGSTDYVELYGYRASAGNIGSSGNSAGCFLNIVYVGS